MPQILHSHSENFLQKLKTATSGKLELSQEIVQQVAVILADVKNKGDDAIISYTQRFDYPGFSKKEMRIHKADRDAAITACNPDIIEALKTAALRIASYSQRQMPETTMHSYKDKNGVTLGWKWTPIESVGIYIPGGTACYPSSVLMTALPAKVAGVKRIVMCVPATQGKINPLVLAAAKIAEVEEIYAIGGAQAIAAMAFGTDTIDPVDKIVGPGNAYVTAAKKLLFGTVGIDMIAGPSEIMVVADDKSRPDWVAADLLSQAEHDEASRSILVTDSENFAKTVDNTINSMLPRLSRKEIATKSWTQNGLIIIMKNLNDAPEIVNIVAPEHVELCLDRAEEMAKKIHNAGAILIGKYTPEAIGDYVAGPSHVLPTAGTARFSSGLGVYEFMKRTSIIGCDERNFNELAKPAELIASGEGFSAHVASINVRAKKY